MGEESFSYRSLLIFGEISALLAIFAGTTYALGLMAIWVPTVVITNDIDTVWLAVSMMRRTVVAGVGIRYLFGIPPASVGSAAYVYCATEFFILGSEPEILKSQGSSYDSSVFRRLYDLGAFYGSVCCDLQCV